MRDRTCWGSSARLVCLLLLQLLCYLQVSWSSRYFKNSSWLPSSTLQPTLASFSLSASCSESPDPPYFLKTPLHSLCPLSLQALLGSPTTTSPI